MQYTDSTHVQNTHSLVAGFGIGLPGSVFVALAVSTKTLIRRVKRRVGFGGTPIEFQSPLQAQNWLVVGVRVSEQAKAQSDCIVARKEKWKVTLPETPNGKSTSYKILQNRVDIECVLYA